MSLVASTRRVALMPAYAKNLLPSSGSAVPWKARRRRRWRWATASRTPHRFSNCFCRTSTLATPSLTLATTVEKASEQRRGAVYGPVGANPQKPCTSRPPQEAADLAFDEAGQADPVGARGSGGEEGLRVLPDDPVQDRVGGGARDVDSHGAGPSGFRAVVADVPDDVPPPVMPGSRRARCNKIAAERCGGPSLGRSSRQATQAEAASPEQDTDSGDYRGRMFARPSGTEWREAKGGDGKIAQANVAQSLPSSPTPSPPARFDSPAPFRSLRRRGTR
jgi:hypothetical protein